MTHDTDMTVSAQSIPDVFLAAAHLDAARAVLGRVTGTARVRLAFVSGSLAAGLGHAFSDVDLYVALSEANPVFRNYREADLIVNVEPLTEVQLGGIARTCRGYTDTAASRPLTVMPDAEFRLPLRYAIGTILTERDTGLPAPEDSLAAIRRTLMNRNAVMLSSFAEDTLGAIQIGDWLTALQASLLAVQHAIECALAAAGDIYLGLKFQLRRLARTPAMRNVLADGLALLQQPKLPGGLDDITGLVLRRMFFCSHMTACSLLDGWDDPIDVFPPFAELPQADGPVRSPWVTPVRFADSWGMAGPATGYRTTEPMVRLWLALDGRDITAILADRDTESTLNEIPIERLDWAVTRLVESGAAAAGGGKMRRKEGFAWTPTSLRSS